MSDHPAPVTEQPRPAAVLGWLIVGLVCVGLVMGAFVWLAAALDNDAVHEGALGVAALL
jgi:hypothetical protein